MAAAQTKITNAGFGMFALMIASPGVAVAAGDWRYAVYGGLAALMLALVATAVRQRRTAPEPPKWPCPTCGLSPDDRHAARR